LTDEGWVPVASFYGDEYGSVGFTKGGKYVLLLWDCCLPSRISGP